MQVANALDPLVDLAGVLVSVLYGPIRSDVHYYAGSRQEHKVIFRYSPLQQMDNPALGLRSTLYLSPARQL